MKPSVVDLWALDCGFLPGPSVITYVDAQTIVIVASEDVWDNSPPENVVKTLN